MIFEAVTSIEEQMLIFIPKIIAPGVIIVVPAVDAAPAVDSPRTCTSRSDADPAHDPVVFDALMHPLGPGDAPGSSWCWRGSTPLFVVAPPFTSKLLPAQVHTIVALVLSVGLTPTAMTAHDPPGPLLIVALIAMNVLTASASRWRCASCSPRWRAGALLDVVAGFSYGSPRPDRRAGRRADQPHWMIGSRCSS